MTFPGSYYVDIVCRLLKEMKNRNVSAIMEKVTQHMHRIIFKTNLFQGKAKQASFYESTFQKSFVFPPYQDHSY